MFAGFNEGSMDKLEKRRGEVKEEEKPRSRSRIQNTSYRGNTVHMSGSWLLSETFHTHS